MPGEDDAARARRASAPVVNGRINGKADGAGLLGTIRKHLHVLDLGSGAVRQVTEGDWHAGDPVWSPDSARLAFGAATAPDADLAPRVPLYTIDVSGGFAKPELVALADGIAAPTAWTPDGAALIVAGTPSVPFGHLRLLRVPLDSAGTVTDLAGSLDRNVMPGGPGYPGGLPTLTDGGATVVFCVRDRGCTHVYATPADGSGTPQPVVAGSGRVVSGLSVSPGAGPGGTAAVALATPDSYGEIVLVDLASGAETVITAHGAGPGEVGLYPRQEREFTIAEATTE